MAEKILEQQRKQGMTSDKAKGWVGATRLLLPVALHRLPADDVRAEPRQDARPANSASPVTRWPVSTGAAPAARPHQASRFAGRLEKSKASGTAGFVKDADNRLICSSTRWRPPST